MFRLILFIFAISNVPVFQEETIFGVGQCELMTLSDALPVQFWLNECDTYNEHEAGGVHHECWCAPWECADPIVTQFRNTTGQNISLFVKNVDGEYIHEQGFTEVQSGVYQTTIIPEDNDICDKRIQLLIASTGAIVRMLAPSSWTNDSASVFDSKTGTQFTETLTSSDNTILAYQTINIPSGVSISFTWVLNLGIGSLGTGGSYTISFFTEDEFTNITSNIETQTITHNGIGHDNPVSFTANLITTDVSTRLYINVTENVSGSNDIIITIPVGQALYISNAAILAKSDCLDVATTQDETIFIEYSNHRNFDGLVYDNASPDLTFGIRVPCRFFHEIEPEEDEAMELTSSIVTTSGQVKTQRLLEVKHSPYYFHKKIRRILKHQTITIFDKSWKKEEPYDILEGNKRWPLKAATCYLTETNSVVRNVL